jgi:hypothetical protein
MAAIIIACLCVIFDSIQQVVKREKHGQDDPFKDLQANIEIS